MSSDLPVEYVHLLAGLKEKIRTARQRAALAVNAELLAVYWEIGKLILDQKASAGWGTKIVKQLGVDLRTEFPDMKGFSDRNLVYMQTFAAAYPDFSITQQPAAQLSISENQSVTLKQHPAAQLPWGHHQVILDKINTHEERLFYIQKCAQNNWSRNVLVHQIESGLYQRQGTLTHNFSSTLPDYQGELAKQLFKDPYQLDFIMLGEEARERDLENALIQHVTQFLLELGDGFAFMGRQKRFEAGGKEFFVDLLFYHTKLRRHIIIELKIGEFEPEFVSKMNLYLGLADDQLKGERDEPSIGLILCKTKNKIVAEYALRDTSKPIGIAEYKIAEMLPADIQQELPSIEEIEQKLDNEIKENQSLVDIRIKAIKQRLKELNTEELQTPYNHEAIWNLFLMGLKPLYERIIKKLDDTFRDDFFSHEISWTCDHKVRRELKELQNYLEDQADLTRIHEITFTYRLSGFKKAGTEDYSEWLELRTKFDQFRYLLLIPNHSKDPFRKKMYHEPLTNQDMQGIEDIMVSLVLDKIEWILEQIEKKS